MENKKIQNQESDVQKNQVKPADTAEKVEQKPKAEEQPKSTKSETKKADRKDDSGPLLAPFNQTFSRK